MSLDEFLKLEMLKLERFRKGWIADIEKDDATPMELSEFEWLSFYRSWSDNYFTRDIPDEN
jgi:hypothetical protein